MDSVGLRRRAGCGGVRRRGAEHAGPYRPRPVRRGGPRWGGAGRVADAEPGRAGAGGGDPAGLGGGDAGAGRGAAGAAGGGDRGVAGQGHAVGALGTGGGAGALGLDLFPRHGARLSPDLVAEVCRLAGGGHPGQLPCLGDRSSRAWGEEHLRTGWPICYTSADSVFQIAAHEEAFGLDRLLHLCATWRRCCMRAKVGRVIARPFTGGRAAISAHRQPRDYAIARPRRRCWTGRRGGAGDACGGQDRRHLFDAGDREAAQGQVRC
jgi:phosphopentomutase